MPVYQGTLTGDDGSMAQVTITVLQAGDSVIASIEASPSTVVLTSAGGYVPVVLTARNAAGDPVTASYAVESISDPAISCAISGNTLTVTASPNPSVQGRQVAIVIKDA